MQDPVRDQLLDVSAFGEGRVEGQPRFRPEQSGVQLMFDQATNPVITDPEESSDVTSIISDEAVAYCEDVH
jgi:hypothetical protein